MQRRPRPEARLEPRAATVWRNSGTVGWRRRGGFTPSRVLTALVGQRSEMPPDVAQFLDEHGDEFIRAIWIHREPLPEAIEGLLNVTTVGDWQRQAEGRKFYHMTLLIFTDHSAKALETLSSENAFANLVMRKPSADGGPNVYVLEKRQVVKLSVEALNVARANGETLPISPIPRNLTVRQLLFNAVRSKGNSIWDYNPNANNCQDFVVTVLAANGMPIVWPKQPVDKLFQSPQIRYVTSHVSDLASRADVVLRGCTSPICVPKPSLYPWQLYLPKNYL